MFFISRGKALIGPISLADREIVSGQYFKTGNRRGRSWQNDAWFISGRYSLKPHKLDLLLRLVAKRW